MLKENITQRYLQDRYSYNQETGELTHKYDAGSAKAGSRVGSIGSYNYWVMRISGRNYKQHRIIWMYMMGDWPTQEIDHINLNTTDNSWTNLRQATPRENRLNNKSVNNEDYGICWDKAHGKWRAQSWEYGYQVYLGLFVDKQEARNAVQKYKQNKGAI